MACGPRAVAGDQTTATYKTFLRVAESLDVLDLSRERVHSKRAEIWMTARVERVKLTANALSTLSVAVAAAGFIKPIVEAVDADLTRYTWLSAALIIHLVARWSLGALEE